MSGTMQKVAGTSDTMVNKLEGMSKKQKELQGMSNSLGNSMFGLKQKIDLLRQEKELIDPSNLEFIKDYNREIGSLEDQLHRLDTAGKSTSFMGGITDKLKGLINPATISAAIVAATGKSALSFEQGMSKVNITAQMDGKSYEELQRKIADVAKDNKSVIELAPASYEQIISQTGDAALSLEILDAAMKGSRAASVDMTTVSAALAQSLSVIGKEATALEVLDSFLTSKRVGAGEFGDFARYLPGMIAGASNLGVHYKEVAGVFAYMTGKGQSAEKAAVMIENAFKVLGKGNIRDNLGKAGVNVFDDGGKIRGLVDIFTDLSGVMSGMTDEQKSSFLEMIGLVDKEAKNSFALLTADLDKFSSSMEQTKNSAGETDRALQYSENGLRRASDLWTKLRNIGFEFGRAILPVIHIGITALSGVMFVLEPVLGATATVFDWWFRGLGEGNPLVWALTTAITATTIALNAATIATKAKALWDGAVTLSTKAWAGAQWLLNAAFWANPIVWVIAGITALVAIITTCITKVDGWGAQWGVIVDFMRNVFDLFVENFKFQWSTLINGFMMGLDKIRLGWYKFKDAVGLGDSGSNRAMIESITADVEARKEAVAAGAKKVKELGENAANSLTWELSWKKSTESADAMPAGDPAAPSIVPTAAGGDFDALKKSLEKSGKGSKSGKGKATKIDLNDTVANMKGTSAYTAIASKLNPVKIASLSAKVAASAALPALVAATEVPQQTTLPEFDAARTEYVDPTDSRPVAVRIVDLSSGVLSKLPDPILKGGDPAIVPDIALRDESQATAMPSAGEVTSNYTKEVFHETERTERGIRMERFCDQIVIHVANTDQRGKDEIRNTVMQTLQEMMDDYGA